MSFHKNDDEEILRELQPWKEIIDAKGNQEVGISRVTLSKSSSFAECNLGSFINDAFVYAHVKFTFDQYSWTTAAVSVCNVGGIRTTLNKGVLTYAHLVAALPFGNTIDSFDLQGKYILEALEYSVTKSYGEEEFSAANMLQLSGLRVTFNITNPIGGRVVEDLIRCQNCTKPSYEPIGPGTSYRIITASFLTNGEDGFTMFRDYKQNLVHGPVDIEALKEYVGERTPLFAGSDDRIIVLK